MYTLLVTVIVLVSFLMIGIVLVQESKGGGLASNFQSANQLFGVRTAHNGVEKITWALAVLMVVISVACAYVAPVAKSDGSVMEGATTEQTATPAMPGASNDAAAGAQKSAPAATQAPAAPKVPASPAK